MYIIIAIMNCFNVDFFTKCYFVVNGFFIYKIECYAYFNVCGPLFSVMSRNNACVSKYQILYFFLIFERQVTFLLIWNSYYFHDSSITLSINMRIICQNKKMR